MYLEYSGRSHTTIALLFPETDIFILCAIFKLVYKFPQSFVKPGYKGKTWETAP